MKKLITTTALVLSLGLPATLFAQAAEPAVTAPLVAKGFLAARAVNQMLATDLIGHDVYARRAPIDLSAGGVMPMTGAAMATMATADLDGMDNVGQINDLVLSHDGAVIALVIGVGGFLGVGERDVAVTMSEVSFVANADQAETFYIVVNTSGEMLKTSPTFDRLALANGEAAANASVETGQPAATGSASDGAPALTELEAAGKVVFEEDIGCIECHGALAKGDVGVGPNIQGKTVDLIKGQMESNELMMFEATDAQLNAVEAYLAYLKANNS